MTILLAASAFAQDDGTALLRGLRARDSIETVQTMSYLDGFLGHAVLWSKMDKACPFKLPEDKPISVGQFAEVATKYLQAHPEQLNERPELLLLLALKESFPR